MSVIVGHAKLNEVGGIYGGLPGDQTKGEVSIDPLGKNPWRFTDVFRCTDAKKAENIGEAMYQTCINDNIGYSQNGDETSGRYSMIKHLKKTQDILKITEKCACDCSSAVMACMYIAGIRDAKGNEISKYMTTSTQPNVLAETGVFKRFRLTEDMILYKGDILWKPGHTAIVVSSDHLREVSLNTTALYQARVTTTLNVRSAPDSSTDATLFTPRRYVHSYDTFAVCDDKANDSWAYCLINGSYGWLSKKYLTKVADPSSQETTVVKKDWKIGDTVKFLGGKVYVSSYKGAAYKSAGSCTATVTRIDGHDYKYHIKSSTGVEGWVDAATLN